MRLTTSFHSCRNRRVGALSVDFRVIEFGDQTLTFFLIKFTAQQPNENKPPTPAHRNTTPSTVRLLQVDVATRDNREGAYTGWIFGTFVYDGRGQSGSVTVMLSFDAHLITLSDATFSRSSFLTLDGAALFQLGLCGVTTPALLRRCL
jgi:hypothetical protein